MFLFPVIVGATSGIGQAYAEEVLFFALHIVLVCVCVCVCVCSWQEGT